jgi:hypothetical protein
LTQRFSLPVLRYTAEKAFASRKEFRNHACQPFGVVQDGICGKVVWESANDVQTIPGKTERSRLIAMPATTAAVKAIMPISVAPITTFTTMTILPVSVTPMVYFPLAFFDLDGLSVQSFAIQRADCGSSFIRIRHAHEADPVRFARNPVSQELNGYDLAKSSKGLA